MQATLPPQRVPRSQVPRALREMATFEHENGDVSNTGKKSLPKREQQSMSPRLLGHERYLVWGAVVSAVALGVSVRLSIIHFIISAASTAMIVHVMLVDKKLDGTLRVIDVLHDIRPYASVLVLVCVGFYFWDALGWGVPAFRRDAVKSATTRSLSLGPEPEEA